MSTIIVFNENENLYCHFIKNIFDDSVKAFIPMHKKNFDEIGTRKKYGFSIDNLLVGMNTLLFLTKHSTTKEILKKISDLITPNHKIIIIYSKKNEVYDIKKLKLKNAIYIQESKLFKKSKSESITFRTLECIQLSNNN